MTKELFRNDSYLKKCKAKILSINEQGIILNKTIFYPESGGQPGDKGSMKKNKQKINITDTKLINNEIFHLVEDRKNFKINDEIICEIDWERRYNIMQVHTSLHLLCSLITSPVTGGQISENKGRLDFDLETKPNKDKILENLNNLIKNNYDVKVSSITEKELEENPNLVRTMSVTPPLGKGSIRMINIGRGVDYQPCGGTHVKNTQEIREVKKVKIENKGRMNKRIIVNFT